MWGWACKNILRSVGSRGYFCVLLRCSFFLHLLSAKVDARVLAMSSGEQQEQGNASGFAHHDLHARHDRHDRHARHDVTT